MEVSSSASETATSDDELRRGGEVNRRPIVSDEHLDVEAYAALYTGRTKIIRLKYIADKCGVPSMELEALRIAYDEAKKGGDSGLFNEIVRKIDGRLGEAYGPDDEWVSGVEKRVTSRREKLETDISASVEDNIKESVRVAYEDLGYFSYEHGFLGEAFRSYARSVEYCSTPEQVVHACMNVIRVSLEMNQHGTVGKYVNKAEETKGGLDSLAVAKLRCVAGLVFLGTKDYKHAARKFLETGFELGNNYSEVIASQDVATYGGLCALASFDRAELKRRVIDNVNFRNFLELVPEVRELINDFYTSRYASFLEYLETLRAKMVVDIYLQRHMEGLYDKIRNKALIQYTLPFVSMDIRMMANAFKLSVTEMEKELEGLITKNIIQAKIDSHNKILYGRHADQRKGTFQRVLRVANKFDQDVRAMLLRASIIMHDCNHDDAYYPS
ncbi:COP9 signalosome complex subunit 1-like [Andrographis paniculata]|uniref:COP9 signalosome complex subunit 1-like n=1 Tax=Andrographis paniculata TaxID=175694 RepID=UPI0021E96ECA|nr:COP9 signalosome complex subunit 1-like [Andrographis paniculata]